MSAALSHNVKSVNQHSGKQLEENKSKRLRTGCE